MERSAVEEAVPPPVECPEWLSIPDPPARAPTKARRLLTPVEFKAMFPTIIDRIISGCTLKAAFADDIRDVDAGAFLMWLKKDRVRFQMYKDAKELRAEVWAGRIIEHAEGTDRLEDIARSKLIVDTYWRLMETDSRENYGRSQSIEVNGSISITAALTAARTRTGETFEHERIGLSAPSPALTDTSADTLDIEIDD